MQLIRRLYDRFSSIFDELAKFGTIGAIAFVIDFGGSNLMRYVLGLGPVTSKVIATVVAATISYLANRYWTWRHREQSGLAREYFLFFVLNGIGLLISVLIISFVEYVLQMQSILSYNISMFIGTALGTLFRFWSYKKWVFLPPGLPPVDPHTGLPEAPGTPAQAPGAEVTFQTFDGTSARSLNGNTPHGPEGASPQSSPGGAAFFPTAPPANRR
ncbi:GtrA family protein [Sphaerisporangium album]|uniref:GtrA family protein n=1 Tax=Sphaerisporangium album TaxID=509200 RepID=A0A367FE50_9ACTN|nr:GtrA family protein [Sphaerisporangium album]RCG27870.1 GtrA family protein [Sphaerisporangium album]